MIGIEAARVAFGARTIFADVSLAVGAGDCVAILGPNGRGKTTLLRAMLGLQPLGSGRHYGPPVVGYVPQHQAAAMRYRVRDVVVMGRAAGLGLFGQPGPTDRDAAEAALSEVGIAPLADQIFERLSGGQRQLVLLARALATGSPVLVLDEPCSALDLANQQRLLGLLARLAACGDRAILFTTHDPNQVLGLARRVALMMPGGAVEQGPVAELAVPERLAALYGVPMRVVAHDGPEGARRAVLPAFAGARAA